MPICFAHEAIELFDQRETKLHLLEPANKCCSNNWETWRTWLKVESILQYGMVYVYKKRGKRKLKYIL